MSKQYTEDQDPSVDEPVPSLEQLIAQQGVTPIEDLNELSNLWPADDDPDLLMQYILGERKARQQVNYSNGHDR